MVGKQAEFFSIRAAWISLAGPFMVGGEDQVRQVGGDGDGAGDSDGAGEPGWLLRAVGTGSFAALVFGDGAAADRSARAVAEGAAAADVQVDVVRLPLGDAHALATQRYDAQAGTVYLLRPDQHVCARWRQPDAQAIRTALHRVLART